MSVNATPTIPHAAFLQNAVTSAPEVDDGKDRVVIVTVQDGRSSNAATARR
ncbi:MAG: hypothetical protein LH654_06005 [Thermoleophilia bacterium]|nr:hypothetical protein [Thermoleophilia bacterium]